MNDTDRQSLRAQIASYQESMAARLVPEVQQRLAARRAELVGAGVGASSPRAGQPAPDFTLPDAEGRPFTFSTLLARGPAVLTFYRGDWCPYCNLTLRAYQAMLPEIEALGAALVAVSPQDADHTQLTVQNKALTFPVLSDTGNRVARDYGLVWTVPEDWRSTSADLPQYNGDGAWELPVPGTFVIDADGRVALSYVNADWTQRLEPAEILDALRHLAAVTHR